jgi:hypothetical protein
MRFNSGVRQGCSLLGDLFVMCLEFMLHNIRRKSLMTSPGVQFGPIIKSILTNDNANLLIKLLAYALDVSTIVLTIEGEHSIIITILLYDKASGNRTNDGKTILFWCIWKLPPSDLISGRGE